MQHGSTYPTASLDAWRPETPGRIEFVYLHWSAHDYASLFPAYHYCIAQQSDGTIVVAQTHDLRENMRDVYAKPERPYAQHTRGRNSYAVGISAMAMENATPHDFGAYPITEGLIDGLCVVAARLASYYDIALDADHVMTHAEAAIRDDYFGTTPEERWDLARFSPSTAALTPREALASGETLRVRMRST